MPTRIISSVLAVVVGALSLSACGEAAETVGDVAEEADETVQLVEFCTAALDVVQAVGAEDKGAAISAAQTMVNEAPEEIAPEAETVLNGVEAAQNGDTEALQSQEFQNAAQEIETYTRENCNPTN